MVDVNGDGKADVAKGLEGTGAALYINTYSTTTGAYSWTASSTYTGSIPLFARASGAVTTGIIGEFNGDGLPDFSQNVPGTGYQNTYLGNGSTWDATTTIFPPKQDFSSPEAASQFIDMNSDGLDDWVYSDSTHIYVLLNTGTGWNASPSPQWTIATSTLYHSGSSYYDRGIRFMDLNGDGLPDFVRAYRLVPNDGQLQGVNAAEVADVKTIYLNTGNGWATSTAYTLPHYIADGIVTQFTNLFTGAFYHFEYANFNGNGQMNQDVLSTVTYPKGGSANVAYSIATSTNPELPFPPLTVNAMATNDGLGNYATTTYSYSEGRLFLSQGVRDRKFAGFAAATTTNPDSAIGIYYNQGYGVDTARGEQNDGFGQINHPFRKDVFDLSGNIKQRTYFRWDTIPHGQSTFVGLRRELTEDFGADGSHRDKATAYLYSSSTNDLLQKIEYGEVTGASDGTFTDIGTDKRTAIFSYVASTSVNISLPIEKTLLDNNSATSSNQRLYYDSLPFGQIMLGNNTRQEDWISGTAYASTTKTYNAFGLVATSTDRNGNATSYVYDFYNLYPATTTNALLQKTQAFYNYSNGKVKQSTDPNGRLTRNLFDAVGRLAETAQSNVTAPTTYATTSAYSYTDNSSPPSSIRRTDYLNAATSTDTYEYYDGLNRLIQTRKSSQAANVYAVSDRVYNKAGEMASTSLPYFSSGSSFTSPTATAALYANYFYDPLRRVTKISNAVGDTTNTYDQWKTTTTDPDGNIKDYLKDAFGNLTNVIEHSSSIGTTTYAYDALNYLATSTDALGNVRHFTYDGLGRRLSAQDLHAVGDGTFGTWTYTYDDAGNNTSQSDPKSQVVNRTYDALNRMLAENYTGQVGTEVTYTYDSCTHGIGYLCIASSTSAITSNAYDILGRTSISTTTVQNIGYATTYAYDRQGNVTGLTYPDGSQVNYSYNLAGFPNRVQRKPSGGSFSDVISNFDYAPHGQIQNTLFGNNASTTYFYNANSMYRLSNLQTTQGGGTYIQTFAYTYDPVGNITQLSNTSSSTANATLVYAYDALNRLLSASTTAASSTAFSQIYTYDLLGNLLTLGAPQTSQSSSSATTSASILDTLSVTTHQFVGTSDSFTYTVPAGGQNKLLVVIGLRWYSDLSITQNGTAFDSITHFAKSSGNTEDYFIATLAAPASGTFSISRPSTGYFDYIVLTLQDAAQTSSVDITSAAGGTASSMTATTTTGVGNDLLLSFGRNGFGCDISGYGTSETQVFSYNDHPNHGYVAGAWKAAAATPGSESMTINSTGSCNIDAAMAAIKPPGVTVATTTSVSTNVYTYAGTGYANPHAATQIANGLSTTTYSYDQNGNLSQKTTDGLTTTYIWDYANRLIALGSGGATTTYGYDAFSSRVFQTTATSTTIYPFKWYSVASSTGSGATYASTTEYVFNGDTLLSTTDQQFASGVATGTAQTHYIHPDHLGSTNVVTNASGTVVQTLDYYPYGDPRINSGQNAANRQFIGQFSDDSGLSYLQARYMDPSRGQFLSEGPTFLAIGNPESAAAAKSAGAS